jgi:hypothetical protein
VKAASAPWGSLASSPAALGLWLGLVFLGTSITYLRTLKLVPYPPHLLQALLGLVLGNQLVLSSLMLKKVVEPSVVAS